MDLVLGVGGLFEGMAMLGVVWLFDEIRVDYRATSLDRGALSRVSTRSMLTSHPPRRGLEQVTGCSKVRSVVDEGRTPGFGAGLALRAVQRQ